MQGFIFFPYPYLGFLTNSRNRSVVLITLIGIPNFSETFTASSLVQNDEDVY